jgi:signal transduction histidine kinase
MERRVSDLAARRIHPVGVDPGAAALSQCSRWAARRALGRYGRGHHALERNGGGASRARWSGLARWPAGDRRGLRRLNQAMELHDSTAQHLVATSLNLMSLRAKAGLGSDEMKLLNEVEISMAEALKELRTFSYLMHPLGLDTDGLCSTIRRYIDGYANRSGLRVKLRLSQKVDKLSLDMQRALFRIVQEALANVHRHACASHVSVDLRWVAGRLHVMVTDNGRGAEGKQEEPAFRPGVGIYGIRARARQFGGDLKIQTGPHGTRIHVATLIERAQRRKASRVH